MALGWIPGLLANIFWRAHGCWQKVPGHAVYFANPYLPYWLVFAYLLFGLVWCLRAGPGRSYLLAGGLSAVSLAAAVFLGAARYDADVNAVVLNVGQGRASHCRGPGTYALVDCGSSNSFVDAGGTAADRLESMGLHRLRCVVVTHYHADHTNGLYELLAACRWTHCICRTSRMSTVCGSVWRSWRREKGMDVVLVTDTVQLTLGDMTLTVYPPVTAGAISTSRD